MADECVLITDRYVLIISIVRSLIFRLRIPSYFDCARTRLSSLSSLKKKKMAIRRTMASRRVKMKDTAALRNGRQIPNAREPT
jgi:hypothetical protein